MPTTETTLRGLIVMTTETVQAHLVWWRNIRLAIATDGGGIGTVAALDERLLHELKTHFLACLHSKSGTRLSLEPVPHR